MRKIGIYYATKSKFKIEEIAAIRSSCHFTDENNSDQFVGDRFDFIFTDVKTDEPLEVDLETMVRHKAISAYKGLLMPCIVEHAGLIFEPYLKCGYPGGLTQPMMDSLGPEDFIRRNNVSGERAVAKAVIGYCDGMSVQIFVGVTEGLIADAPRGSRDFYWDTIFIPDGLGGDTYAEVSQDPSRGIPEKMTVSQSFKALKKFLEHRVRKGPNALFTDFDR